MIIYSKKMEISKERKFQGVGDNTTTCTCQQCNESLHVEDTKPTYNPSGEIVGRICYHCRIKNVEYARKCQILGCNAPDSKNSGFRTLPSKFYDLEEGDVKIRIVKQFGITESTRACCNVCYMRISKAIVQMKIVYGDGILKSYLNKKTSKEMNFTKPGNAGSRILHNKEAPVGITKELKESMTIGKAIENEHHKSFKYTGPQFKRKCGVVPSWLQHQRVKKAEDERNEAVQSNAVVNNEVVEAENKYGNESINVDCKLKNVGVNYDQAHHEENVVPTSDHLEPNTSSHFQSTNLSLKSIQDPVETSVQGNVVPLVKSTNLSLGGVFTAGGMVVQSNVSDGEQPNPIQNCDSSVISQPGKILKYSTISISPTATRFCRILPKPSELIQDKLATTIDTEVRLSSRGCTEEKVGEKVGNLYSPEEKNISKEDSNIEDLESELSSSDSSSTSQSEKFSDNKIRKQRRPKSHCETETTSDIVSCMGCHKICSVREAKPVFDYEKGFCGRLCNECRIKKREDNKKCPISGCKTPFKDVVLKPVPPKVLKLKGKLKQKFYVEYGLTDETKVCCRLCWKKINTLLKNVRFRSKQLKSKSDKNKLISKEGAEKSRMVDTECNSTSQNCGYNNNQVESRSTSYTMCRNCYSIIRMDQTVPNIEANGRKCGVLCYPCAGINSPDDKSDSDQSTQKADRNGVCRAKGCVVSGQTTALVSCQRVIRSSQDEDLVRKEFHLSTDNNLCCRSCLAKIKWFITPSGGKKGAHRTSCNTKRETLSGQNGDAEKEPSQEAQVECGTSLGLIKHNSSYPIHHIDAHQSRKVHPASMNHDATTREMPYLTKGQVCPQNSGIPLSFQSNQIFHNPPQLSDTFEYSKLPCDSFFRSHQGKLPGGIKSVENLSANHPPLILVGGQQFALKVTSGREQSTQTNGSNPSKEVSEKAVQCLCPVQLNTNGQVAGVRRVTYQEAKEKTKYIIKKQGKHLFDQFLTQLDEISGGFGRQLLQDVYYSKEAVMAINYEKILSNLGMQYHNTEKSNKIERLRILSLVALNASNELLKKHFQRPTKKGELTSVTEGEIAQAREYSKQFGPGVYVVPEKVAELSKNKGLLLSLADNTMETKDESDSHCKETLSNGVTKPLVLLGAMSSTSTTEAFRGSSDVMSETNVPSPLPLIPKTNELKNDGTPDVKVSTPLEMVQLKIVKKIAGVPVVDFGSNLPCKNQMTGTSVPFIATFKYKPTLSVAPSQNKDITQVVNTESIQAVYNSSPTDLGPKERLNKKLKKKALHASQQKKVMDENDKLKKSPGKNKHFKRSLMIIDNNDPKNKRMRTSFTKEEREMLEEYFKRSMYVTKDLMKTIQSKMGLDKKKIDTWFRNRRSKAKKTDGSKGGNDDVDYLKDGSLSHGDSFLSNCSDNSMSMDLTLDAQEKTKETLNVENNSEIKGQEKEIKTQFVEKSLGREINKAVQGDFSSTPLTEGIEDKTSPEKESVPVVSGRGLSLGEKCGTEIRNTSLLAVGEFKVPPSNLNESCNPSSRLLDKSQSVVEGQVKTNSTLTSSDHVEKSNMNMDVNVHMQDELVGKVEAPCSQETNMPSTLEGGSTRKYEHPETLDATYETLTLPDITFRDKKAMVVNFGDDGDQNVAPKVSKSPTKELKDLKMTPSVGEKAANNAVSMKKGYRRPKYDSPTPSRESSFGNLEALKGESIAPVPAKKSTGDNRKNRSSMNFPKLANEDHSNTADSVGISIENLPENEGNVKSPTSSSKIAKQEHMEITRSNIDFCAQNISKRDRLEDRLSQETTKYSKKDSLLKEQSYTKEADRLRLPRRDSFETAGHTVKEKYSNKKHISDDDEKSSCKRRKRNRFIATGENDSNNGRGEEKVDDSGEYRSKENFNEKSTGGTSYETRSRTR